MLHYDIMFSMISLNNSWKQLISQTEKFDNNWYLRRKKTLGNYKYVQWKIVYPAIILSLLLSYFILFLIIQFSDWNASAIHLKLSVDSIFYFLPTIILAIIYYKTPPFNDMLFIRPELRYIWISFVLYVMVYSTVWTYFAIVNPSQELYNWILFVETVITATIQFLGAMAATWFVNKKLDPLIKSGQYVLKKNRLAQSKKKQKYVESISLLSDHSDDDEKDAENNNNVRRINQNPINLTEIFIQSKALEIFSVHLANELSLENLVCIIECLQFQAFVHEFMTSNDNDNSKNDGDNENNKSQLSASSRISGGDRLLLYEEIVFAEIVPLSSIVFDNETHLISMMTKVEFLLHAKEKCYLLYEKYIMSGSEMEINLSSKVKKTLNAYMKNYNEFIFSANYNLQTLLHIYDQTVLEIYNLMNDSLQRFALSYEFEKLRKLYLVNY